jgi:2-oxo-3-hexenedioate decarboxylase
MTGSTVDVRALALELMDAYATRRIVAVPPSTRDPHFDLTAAYAVEAELVRLRTASGRRTAGRKVGFANKAAWRLLGLDTLVWAHMYDDTVHWATADLASLSVEHMCSPRVEPEIVFKLSGPIPGGDAEPAVVLGSVEWLALGFEIVDCVFAGWTFQPSDFVAAFGLHAALVVGEPRPLVPEIIATVADQLPRFKARLMKDGTLVDEGSGRNSLRSPALCLRELASAIARRPGAEPLAVGELVSSGTLTESHPIAPGETWTAAVEGLDLPALTLRVS